MSKLLMSIKPKYVDSILAGTKKYEFRKVKCKQDISSILIYETAPIKKIVAEVEILDIWSGTPAALWQKTFHAAGINKEEYTRYFKNCTSAVAYCLGEPKIFDPPLPLSFFVLSRPPQSYCYVTLKRTRRSSRPRKRVP